MKALVLIISLSLMANGVIAQTSKPASGEMTQNIDKESIVTGKVVKIADNWLIETTNKDGSIDRLLPSNMPENLKKEGLEVVFSGTRGTIPPNVRVMGVPFELNMIREIEQIQAPDQDSE